MTCLRLINKLYIGRFKPSHLEASGGGSSWKMSGYHFYKDIWVAFGGKELIATCHLQIVIE